VNRWNDTRETRFQASGLVFFTGAEKEDIPFNEALSTLGIREASMGFPPNSTVAFQDNLVLSQPI
jgi:hypothetical protein